MALTYEQITLSIVAESGMTRVAFEKLAIEQRVYLVNKHLGVTTSKLYEKLDSEIVLVLASEKAQGGFNYTFKYITEATALFKEISELLNTTLYGIYGIKTRYFMLTETFTSLMKHLEKQHLVANILSGVAATSVSTGVSVPSIGNVSIGISALEIREILDRFTKSIYDKHLPTLDILTESLLLSLLDVNFEDESIRILNNFENISDTLTELGDNLVSKTLIGVTDNIHIGSGLTFSMDGSKSSELRLYNDGINILTTDTHLVEVVISKYESGSLEIYFGGDLLYNDTPTKGTLSFNEKTPSTSSHTTLVIKSDDFKGIINNISIRKITS